MIFRRFKSFRKILDSLQPVLAGEVFENGWLRTADSEQSEITACDVIRFLTIKIYFGIPL